MEVSTVEKTPDGSSSKVMKGYCCHHRKKIVAQGMEAAARSRVVSRKTGSFHVTSCHRHSKHHKALYVKYLKDFESQTAKLLLKAMEVVQTLCGLKPRVGCYKTPLGRQKGGVRQSSGECLRSYAPGKSF